jgi:putative membrane protein
VKWIAAAAFTAGVALLVFLLFRAGFTPLRDAFLALGIGGLLAITAVHLPIIALLGTAWWLIAGEGAPRLIQFVWARAVRDAAGEALPFSQVGGYVIGARALSLAGASASRSSVSTLLDITLEFFAKLPYVLLGLSALLLAKGRGAVPFAAPAIVICFALMLLAWRWRAALSFNMIAHALQRWPAAAEFQQRFATLIQEMRSRRTAVARGVLLHFVCWLAGTGETWLLLHLMHLPTGPIASLVIDSVVGGIRAISFFVPGAIGVQEGGYVLICGLFGLSPGAALAVSLARRGRDLLIAAPVLLSWQWREGRALLRGRFKS